MRCSRVRVGEILGEQRFIARPAAKSTPRTDARAISFVAVDFIDGTSEIP